MHGLEKCVVDVAIVFIVAYVFYRIGYDNGYFDAVKEYIDKIGRRPSKNWIKCMAKYAEKRKEADDGKNRSCSGDDRDDGVGGDRGKQEPVGQASVY